MLQLRSRARPFRYDRGEEIERADLGAAKVRPRRKKIGEYFPVMMQACARAIADELLQKVRDLSGRFPVTDVQRVR